MSKEPDAKDPGRRRRRKGGGLRVPSDNVPRRSADEVAAPKPEEPRLAVSVAYAFDGSGAAAAPAAAADLDDDELPTVVKEGATELAERRPDTEETTSDVPTEEMAAIEPSPGDPEDRDERAPTADAARRAPTADVARRAPTADAARRAPTADSVDIPIDEETGPPHDVVAAPEPGADGATSDAPEPGADGAASDAPEPGADAATSDAPEPVADAATTNAREEGADAATTNAREAGADAATTDAREEGEESAPGAAPEARADAVPEPWSDAAAEPEDEPAPVLDDEPTAVRGRAKTVALTEADLEELSDEGAQVANDEHDDEVTGAAVPSPAIERAESGELVADDMIEELEAGEAEAVAVAQTSEPDEGRATSEGGVRKRAETAEPPPPPVGKSGSGTPPRASKPPPAPASTSPSAAAPKAKPAAKERRAGRPWFEEIFDEDYLRTLPFLTPQATQSEASFVVESLGIDPGAQVLDVGCGYGRHAMELAARGYHVVGLDSSLPLLLRGADEAQRRGLTINFVHGDMREMNFDSQFDGAYCLFSTFGYFDDETNKKVAQQVSRALKPGGRLVIEVLNRDYLIADLPSRVWWEGDGCVVLEEVEFNYFSSRIVSNRSVVFDDGRQLEQEISLRSFSLHELGKLLHAAGFRVLEISGSMVTRGRFFGAHSRDIVVVAERRPLKTDAPE